MIFLALADDHTLFREGLKSLLQRTGDMVVSGEASNGREALALLSARTVDLLVLDLSMPGRDGIALIRRIRAEHPNVPILVLTMHAEAQYAADAIKAGAAGYLTKDCAAEELARAVRRVAAGGHYLSPSLAEKIVFERHGDPGTLPHLLLSAREFAVFRYLATGLTNSEIAELLSVSVKTVSTYKARIFVKMRMTNQAALVRYAIRNRLIELENGDGQSSDGLSAPFHKP
ncbi:response regulator transcription factor [Pusillimonas sp.]|uniref:response regulator transcription factor n=1 Tax=Pusillimonas sp. TaxID=3040095 RepID=UPI0029A5F434|nr:response regulator transcription factor [Pusillimonas sp.]MDX3893202.1 response regulator transcription factor [Pusillimonas sp.]